MSPEENCIVGDPVPCISRLAARPDGNYIAALVTGAVIGAVIGALFAALVIFIVAGASVARAQGSTLIPPTPQEEADIQTWIPRTCCWSNKCCFKVPRRAVKTLGRDLYRVEATGQIVSRTDWSRDGQTWRCTCDYDPAKGWVAHEQANTRCLFPVADAF